MRSGTGEVSKMIENPYSGVKFCPFCHGVAYIVYVYDYKRYYVKCEECLCRTGYYDSEEKAIAKWNRRISDKS